MYDALPEISIPKNSRTVLMSSLSGLSVAFTSMEPDGEFWVNEYFILVTSLPIPSILKDEDTFTALIFEEEKSPNDITLLINTPLIPDTDINSFSSCPKTERENELKSFSN